MGEKDGVWGVGVLPEQQRLGLSDGSRGEAANGNKLPVQVFPLCCDVMNTRVCPARVTCGLRTADLSKAARNVGAAHSSRHRLFAVFPTFPLVYSDTHQTSFKSLQHVVNSLPKGNLHVSPLWVSSLSEIQKRKMLLHGCRVCGF